MFDPPVIARRAATGILALTGLPLGAEEPRPDQPPPAPPPHVAAAGAPAETGLSGGYDGGFYLRGGPAKLTLEGLLQVNGSFFERGAPHPSTFALRRMRLEVSGEFFDRWLFHIEPNFAAEGVEMEEAWVGLQAGTHRFMFGRMKEPFELEEMASQRHMDMLNFSILNQFAPAEDHGVTVLGTFDAAGREGLVEYGLGFYNGTGGEDTTSDKDAALRVVLHPWRGLQFGGSGTFGRQRQDVGGAELRTEARVPWTEFVPGTTLEDERVRLGAEAAFLEGPFAVTTEAIRVREVLNDAGTGVGGGYVQASYVLTGEEKTWKGVRPARPFLRDPAPGAWQLVARWSRLHLDDDLRPFLTNFPGRIDSYTLGVNWYANDFVKVKVNYVRTAYEHDIVLSGDRHDNEDALLCQFQVMF
jgi:phosphate-selective porin OprO/OprP